MCVCASYHEKTICLAFDEPIKRICFIAHMIMMVFDEEFDDICWNLLDRYLCCGRLAGFGECVLMTWCIYYKFTITKTTLRYYRVYVNQL